MESQVFIQKTFEVLCSKVLILSMGKLHPKQGDGNNLGTIANDWQNKIKNLGLLTLFFFHI